MSLPTKNHKALDKRDQNSKRLNFTHLYQGKEGNKRNKLRKGEWKVSTEKPKPKLNTRNNYLSQQSIHIGNHYPNLDWQT